MKKVVLLVLLFASLGSFTSRAQNLIPNGGFENDLAGWWTQAASGTNASFTVVTDDKAEGSKALKVDVITPGANAWNVQAVNDPWASVAGKEYTLTFWAKAATSGSSFKMIQQNTTYAEKTITLTNTWQKHEWTFTAQEAQLQLKFHFPAAGTFYIDGITIPKQEPVKNLILNGSFESGSGNSFANWWAGAGNGTATFTAETGSGVQEGARAFKAEVTALGPNTWDVQAVNDAWPSVTGKEYTLTFWAKAATSGSRFKAVMQAGNSYAEKGFTLTDSWQEYNWTFIAGADNLQLKFQFLSTGTFYIDNILIPAPSQLKELLTNGSFENDFANWNNLVGGQASAVFAVETSDKAHGNKAMRVNVTTPGANAWDVQSINTPWASVVGKTYTLTFYAKAATPGKKIKVLQQTSTYAAKDFELTDTWKKYDWTFTAQEAGLQLRLNFMEAGTFYIDNMSILGEEDDTPAPEPYTPTGPPIATGQPKFLGGVYSASQLPNFTAYWNQVVAENAGKWGAVEATRDVMNWTELDAAYKLAKDNGFPFRMHVLIWGNQQPAWIENLSPAEQLEEIEEWFAAVAERYPDIAFLEVVNEPTNDPPVKQNATDQGSGNYIEALGGKGATGWDWVINSFKLARKHFPNTPLMLNDYSVENTMANAQRYKGIIDLLQQENLIDAIGIQGHAFSTRGTTAATLKTILDLYATTNLPVYITELDIDGITDAIQLAEYQRIFPVMWEHPAVKGITLWGYRPGHWRTTQGAYLAHANGAERSALKWLREYVQSNTNVNIPVVTPAQAFEVSEAATNNTVAGTLKATDADANTTFQGWRITGGSGASVFAINAATGQVTVANRNLLDFEKTTRYTLTVTVHDGFSTSKAEAVTVNIINANDNAPIVTAAQSFVLDAAGNKVVATDADDTNQPGYTTFRGWAITGGNTAGIFAIEAGTGVISIKSPRKIDFTKTSYTLTVTVSDGVNTSAGELITIVIPEKIYVCHQLGQVPGGVLHISKLDVPDHLKHGDSIGQCADGKNTTVALDGVSTVSQLKSAEAVSVYPNPSPEGSFTIAVTDFDAAKKPVYQIIDAEGRKLAEQEMNGNTSSNNLKLKPGIYFIRLISNNEVTVRKIIVQ